jgi:hypothetical protein
LHSALGYRSPEEFEQKTESQAESRSATMVFFENKENNKKNSKGLLGMSAKRSLALREFALGIEALERFVRQEPLGRVHECVFGVLALESEPVDPRL